MEKINYLLNQVGSLLKSYEKLAKSTGENFNIFSVMGMERDEVKTHSRVIAELLNPKGSHSQGSVFLKIFFQEIESLREIQDFDFDNAIVKVEEYIGPINKDYTEGGYIDIIIKDKTNQVVIENKIDALDQYKQLYRYKMKYLNCKLLYLTLKGGKPSEESYKHDPTVLNLKDIVLVSYRSNILSWLEKCIHESVTLPVIRETLIQYSNLIKKLTNQPTNDNMSDEIKSLIKNNYLEAAEINKNFEVVKKEIVPDFFKDVANTFNQSDKNTDWEMTPNANESNQYFIKNRNWNNVALAIWIKKNDVIYYGVKLLNANLKNDEIISNVGNYKTSPNSLLWDDKFVVIINTPEDISSLIKDKDVKVISVIDFIENMIANLKEYCEKTNEILAIEK